MTDVTTLARRGEAMRPKMTLRIAMAEAERVRELLRAARSADRDEQKKVRHRLRHDIGLSISDFTSSKVGCSEADFDKLVERRAIKIL